MPARIHDPLRIRGVVVDAQGRPVPGARVALGAGPAALPDIALLTDDDGSFWVEVPTPGEYAVLASTDSGSGEARVTVNSGEQSVRIVVG
ncbi:carboxypeptidase-like regulatory domain-containing protein [Granulicoccus phenolivorans]|uniref:carboxypeptidase-like regulatory domain-containing protein n=1 Tax=Granulicoccus phenolivorans TaxID=266854 RepID=UPI00041867FA|nr:carboxypeptidase-like regulatory domain-containing protein [Granulicoccus phenolivorans]